MYFIIALEALLPLYCPKQYEALNAQRGSLNLNGEAGKA